MRSLIVVESIAIAQGTRGHSKPGDSLGWSAMTKRGGKRPVRDASKKQRADATSPDEADEATPQPLKSLEMNYDLCATCGMGGEVRLVPDAYTYR